eukprot:IDg13569t1
MQKKMMEDVVLGAAKQIEAAVDDEIARLDTLGNDDLEAIRRRRLAELKLNAERRARWRLQGHGQLREMKERDFFARAKQSERVAVLFRRKAQSRVAQDFVDHIARVAERHDETLFVVLDAEDAPFLTERFGIRVLPSIVTVRDSKVDKVFHGLSELDHTGKFDTKRLEQALFRFDVVADTRIADED